jgi:predicted nucleic-acid-binding protein
MIGLDTNILLRATTQDDPLQSPKARKIIKALSSDQPGYVNLLVLAEFAWTLERRYEYPAEDITAVIEAILGSDSFVLCEHDAVGRAIERTTDENLRFSDALIGELNLAAGCAHTLTFDRAAGRSDAFKSAD